MKKNIFIAGHNGMVGSALIRNFSKYDFNIITADRKSLDLTNQSSVKDFFRKKKIDEVYLAAAKVGGIYANSTFPAEFIYQNLMIQANVIHSAYHSGVQSLLFLGSSCIYPKLSMQPIKEDMLLTGPLEETNEPYALAKITGIKMCESYNKQYGTDYRCVMPTNLYGPEDNFHLKNSHVIPALIKKFHDAKHNSASEVKVWGTGKAKREFLHVDDLAEACMHIMKMRKSEYQAIYDQGYSHVNIGTGIDITIKDLSMLLKKIIKFEGDVNFDAEMPEGTPRKVLDVDLINRLEWKPKISLNKGLDETYKWFKENLINLRK